MTDSSGDDPDEGSHVVTAFLRDRGEVLLGRRSDAVGTYPGRWGGVSGFAEGEPDERVRAEIEAGIGLDASLVRSGRPVRTSDPDLGREWIVHPYLFAVDGREVTANEEFDAIEWVPPTAILESDRETVPELWTVYERVAPTVRSIAADDEHGAAALSVRTLEVLRDRAGVIVGEAEDGNDEAEGKGDEAEDGNDETEDGSESDDADETPRADGWDELAALARRLCEARPSMAVLANRVNRAMATAESRTAAAVLESTIEGIERAFAADEGTATRASEYADGAVMTISRSGTVRSALREGEPTRVYVAESRPAREGVGVAEELAAAGLAVTIHTDAAAAHLLASEDVDCVLVGADAVAPDGRVLNKTGTRAIAAAAARDGVPVYAVAASDKISTRETGSFESGPRAAVYDGDAAVDVTNPTFDVTPADLVTGVVTERGVLSTAEVRGVAAELDAFESWREDRERAATTDFEARE